MRTIDAMTYQQIADDVLEKMIGVYYSSSIFGDTYIFSASIILYLSYEELGDGQTETHIDDAVPIWWEFHTYDEEGDEVPNDFKFSELKKYIQR